MSLMVGMVKPPHGVIDDLIRIFLPFLREVQIHHGGFKVGMPQVALNNADVDPWFKQVRGIGVPQGVDRNTAFFDGGGFFGLSESTLHAVNGHRQFGSGRFLMPPAESGEEQLRISVRLPVAPQQV